MKIAGRSAIVTGGGVRVGRALALGLAARGADVFVHYNRSRDEAEATAGEVRALGARAATGAADLSDPASAGPLVAAAAAALGPPSILINSASGFPEDSIENVTPEAFRSTLDLTLLAPVFLTQALAGALASGHEGAVINVSDVRTASPKPNRFSYSIAKGGVEAFTRAAALHLAPRIRVNAVALGVILPPPGEDDAYAERLAQELPLARVGGTEPVVAATLALVENDFITGEVLRVDGGWHLT